MENGLPIILTIFGATGDLARAKLFPALYKLKFKKRLPQNFLIVGFSRRPLAIKEYRELIKKELKKNLKEGRLIGRQGIFSENLWQDFSKQIFYFSGDFDDPVAFKNLNNYLTKLSKISNRIFYLATPPNFYASIVDEIKETELANVGKNAWRRVLIEKPFGRDLRSSKVLEERLYTIFNEEEIFRVDHYLGKETVQNLLVFRFANSVFETNWNKDFIDHVQITAAETAGVETRGGFYEQTGVLRDMIQNHLLNLVALIAMEQPRSTKIEDIASARHKVLSSLVCYDNSVVDKYVVRGQYGPASPNAGQGGPGKEIVGYRDEADVSSQSNVETFVALKVFIHNDRWADVPFYLRTGKRLPKKSTEISIHFKSICRLLFGEKCGNEQNILSIRIQPEEGIIFRVIVKKPGFGLDLRGAPMEFSYGRAFGEEELVDSYERVFVDVLEGDHSLFSRSEGIEASWQFIDNILYAWETQDAPKFPNYKAGSWGPQEADELIKNDGREWFIK